MLPAVMVIGMVVMSLVFSIFVIINNNVVDIIVGGGEVVAGRPGGRSSRQHGRGRPR